MPANSATSVGNHDELLRTVPEYGAAAHYEHAVTGRLMQGGGRVWGGESTNSTAHDRAGQHCVQGDCTQESSRSCSTSQCSTSTVLTLKPGTG